MMYSWIKVDQSDSKFQTKVTIPRAFFPSRFCNDYSFRVQTSK
jgi:hypothetical protein